MGFIFYEGRVHAQNQSKADSLIQVFDANLYVGDSVRLEILRGILVNHTDLDVRLEYVQEAYKIAKRESNPLWLFRIAIEEGNIYKKKGNLQKSLQSLFQSLEFAKEIPNKKYEAVAFTAIGTVYKVEGNFQTALHYFNQSIRKFREVNDSIRLATTLMNTGELYRINHQLDSALRYFAESGAIFNLQKHKVGMAYNLGNIGLVYAEQGKHHLAEQNINDATAILEELGDRYPIAVYNTYMADIYKERGEISRALEFAEHSYSIAIEEDLKEQIRDASLKLSELFSDLRDYQKAYSFQSRYIAYRDSINNEETVRKMADLRREYEVSQKQAEVDLLNVQKDNQQIISIGLALMIFLVGVMAFMFYKNSKQRQRTNLVLNEQKEEIEAQRDQLDELNKSKDKFFSIISHDLRGPVHAFKGMSRLIKMYIDNNNIQELDELNKHLDKSVDQLSHLLDELLEWAVAQQGSAPYKPENVNLYDVAEDLTALFRNMARAKNILLKADVPENIDIWADRNSLRTILRNLVNNSLKFTEEGGSIIISANKENDMAAIRVADTGRGIPKDQMENLFKLGGQRKRSWGTEGEKGLGLGLQLVYSFSEMNGGQVRVQSEEGKGTTFTLSIPLYKGSSEPVPSTV